MANRFLNNITINDEYTLPSADGTADQIITTNGAGQLSFVDQSTVVSGASRTVSILVKNISSADGGVNLSKGDPVYVYGSVGASERLYVDLADAGDSSKMPCVALLDQDLSPNGEGTATVTGKLKNLITSPIDGATPTENDTIYVKSGGGLTLTKPTGSSNLIQNVGQVGRVSTSSDGNIVVSAILRSNDVPNLTTGKIWVGSAANTIESSTVHLDETNNRLGVNQTSPIGAVHIVGPNTNPTMTTSALVIEQGDGAKILIDGNDIDAAAGMLYLNDYSTNDVVFGGQIRVGGGGSPVGNSWFANGNVGIGTTGPDYKLEVSGTLGVSRTDGIIFAGSIGTGTGSKIVSNTSNDLIFSTALTSAPYTTTERVRILNNGNVGIGTDSPNNNLEIKSAFPGIRLNTTSTVYPTFGKIDAYNNTTYRGGLTWAHNPAQDGARITYVGFPSGTQTTGTFEVGSNFVDTSINNGSMVTRLNTTGLGIGTTSPNRLLTVQTTSTGSYIAMNASTGNTTIGSDVNGGFIVYDDTNSSYRMVINRSTGNVGIGTTSPTPIGTNITTLDIQGSSGGGFRFGTTGGVEGGIYTISSGSYIGSISNIPLYFRTNNNTKATILANGNFGIGTTSPSTKLHALGTSSSMPSLGAAPTAAHLGGSSYGTLFSTLTSGRGVIQQGRVDGTATSYDLLLQPVGGNVGIGTTSSSEKLEVNGAVKATAATDAYKGYIKSVITTGYSMKSASTAYQYIPYNSYTLTTLQAYYNRTVAAYNGRVKKIIVKRIDGASADATGMKFKKEINGTVNATEYTATVLSGSGNFQATYNFANSDFTFSAGDSIGVLMQSSGGTGMIGAGAIQIVLEYNIT